MENNTINDSILGTMKEMLVGSIEDNDDFDTQLIVHINSVLSALLQIMNNQDAGYLITGDTETWSDFVGSDIAKYNMIKSYMYLRLRLIFDPPANSFIVKSFEDQAKELEWRLCCVR